MHDDASTPTSPRAKPTALLPILRLHDHKRDARDAFLERCRLLTDAELRKAFPIGMGSLWNTLAHLLGADLVWIDALTGAGGTALLGADDVASLDELIERWSQIDGRWHGLLATLSPDQLSERVTRRSALRDAAYTITTLDILLHVCTHQAHTIAQGRNMLRSLGVGELDSSDLVFWAVDRPLGAAGTGNQ